MKNRKGRLLLFLGCGLIAAGLCLMLFFQLSGRSGDRNVQAVYTKINAMLPERTQGVPGDLAQTAMPVLELEGTDYVALLEIPACQVTLPVADRWEGHSLTEGPARYHGSVCTGDLVIGGTDRAAQFGFCSQIENGAVIKLTDMTGTQFSYRVSRVDRSDSATAQWLIREAFDLTLYCRQANSFGYIAVRCDLEPAVQ